MGKSVKIGLEFSLKTNKATRKVTEHVELVKMSDASDLSQSKSGRMRDGDEQDDPDLISLDTKLKEFEKEFGKSSAELADIFCKVSGRLNKMRDYLENKASVVEWNYLEDLALEKAEESPEFQILLQTKGFEEIKIRREFLQAEPVIVE